MDVSKAGYPSATRTVVVNGQKDMYVNYDMTNLLEKIPRSEVRVILGYVVLGYVILGFLL